MLEFRLQRFAEGEETPTDNAPQTVKIGDEELSLEQIAERMKSYNKLQSQFTKVSQENSDLKKSQERAQAWIQFEDYVSQFPPEVRAELGQTIDTFLEAKRAGTVTQKDISGINKAIRTAEKAGEQETADVLKSERDEALAEILLDREINAVAKQAKGDGVDFDEDEFRAELAKYLEEEGYEDEFDTKEVKRFYRLYKADKKEQALEKERKERLPDVGSGGSGIGISTQKPDKPPKNLKEAHKLFMGSLGRR